MRKILVINAKGGCGKTTIATNLASYYAASGKPTALFDYDPQGSSLVWLDQRPEQFPAIFGVNAQQQQENVTRSFLHRVPAETERVVIDTPACIRGHQLGQYLRDVQSIVIPILPSIIDTNATERFINEIHQISKIHQYPLKIYLIANRIKPNTRALYALEQFVEESKIPLLGQLRDTVNYAHATNLGVGIHELPHEKADRDRIAWKQLVEQLEATR